MIKHLASPRQQRHELTIRFEKIRNLLLTDRYAEQLGKPLDYWTLPADRRLPRALLHRTLGDLLRTPFSSLAAVPGIGQKKIQSLLKLLDRALHTEELAHERLEHVAPQAAARPLSPEKGATHAFHGDPSNISEVTWATWRATVVTHRLGREPLGCFAEALNQLPRVIWSTPLEHYAGLTLADIRKLKTHGEKRVRSVVTIFGQLHSQLDGHTGDARAVVRLTPERVEQAEQWTDAVIASGAVPTCDELKRNLVEPLVEQIQSDAGPQTATMLRGRLGLDGPALSVRKTAMRLRLTRARIYQLLEDAATVVDVRWPRGKSAFRALLERCSADKESAEYRLLRGAAETLFPVEFRPVPEQVPAFVRRFQPTGSWSSTALPVMPHAGFSSPLPTGTMG
jgi:hypothetical protein